jgi:chromosomal replication initiator protein
VDSSGSESVSAIQSLIAEKVGPQRYKVWFKNSTRLSLTKGFLKVDVPNLFVGSWIEDHFTDSINAAAREVIGHDVHVTYAVDPELSGTLRKRQFDSQAEFIATNPERQARERRRATVQRNRAANNGHSTVNNGAGYGAGTNGAGHRAGPARRNRDGSDWPDPVQDRPLRGRLDEFVVGPSNRIAYSASVSVAEAPATNYNPLFVHGGCGLGKTHLLQGVCNAVRQRHPASVVRYLSGEEFTNQYIYAMKNRCLEAFRQDFRHLDVLVIDDIHFLANKKATQEEFLHTFNAIDGYGKQVVMASDAHPKLIGQLSEKLVTRFLSGMVVRIDPPDLEMRCEILRRRATMIKHAVLESVIRYIAENLETNARELEGALLKLVAYSSVSGEPITVGIAKQALEDHLLRTAPIIRLSDIETAASTYFGLTPADLHSSRKTRTIALARSIVMFLARKHTPMSFPEIGRFLGNKNHSTVILACRKIQRLLDADGTVLWVNAAGKEELRIVTLLGLLEEQLGKSARSAPP